MRQNQIVLLLFLALLISIGACKKKKEEENSIVHPDDILYVDYLPDTIFTSIRDWTWEYNSLNPVPSDSFAGMKIDIDQDGIDDLEVWINHSYEFISASNYWANYDYRSSLSMINEKDYIAYDPEAEIYANNVAKPFEKDSIISDKSLYVHIAYPYLNGYYWGHRNVFSGDTYFGFKLTKNGKKNFGWILLNLSENSNSLTIKEFAINRTKNNPIKAGQKQ